MSKNEWEKGTITLPTAEVPKLKKVLRDLSNSLHEEVRAEALAIHKGINTRSLKKYAEALQRGEAGFWARAEAARQNRQGMVHSLALSVLRTMVWQAQREQKTTVNQPTVADISRVAPKLTVKDNSFPVFTAYGSSDGASLVFNGRDIEWYVSENNHAVETAHDGPTGKALFGALAKITWTRGTGGHGTGNDEYNQDNRDYDSGANYVTFTYGPLGEEVRAYQAGMSVAKYRKLTKEAEAREAERKRQANSYYGYGYRR